MKRAVNILLVSLAAAVLLTACASPPANELDAARSAIDAVVSEGAELYTPDELQKINNKVEKALAEIKLQDELVFKNYSLAKFNLEQAKTEAEALKDKIAQRKDELKSAAVTALSDAQASVAEARALLEVAPQGKGSLADIEAIKGDVVGLETELESVQPQIDAGEYIAATEKALAVTAKALTISSDIKNAQEKQSVVMKQ